MFLDNVAGEVLIQHFHIIFGNTRSDLNFLFLGNTRGSILSPGGKEVRNLEREVRKDF